jgi:hypothetical protein
MRKHRVLIGSAITVCFLALFVILKGDTSIKSEGMDEAAKSKLVETYLHLPLHFIKNDGQVDERVKFYEKGVRHSTFFTEEGIYFSLFTGKDTVNVRLTPVNGKEHRQIIGENRLEGRVNYFIGNDREKWKTNISTYSAMRYVNIYENTDVRFYGSNGELEYDIVIRPGGDPSVVKFSFEGIDGLKVTEDGDLLIDVKGRNLIQKRPYIYQRMHGKRVEVAGGFRVYDKNTYGFQLASYNADHLVIIDPVLVYSTYLGGSGDEPGYTLDIAVDGSGNAYFTGLTESLDFPTQDPIQPNHGGGARDAFVTKINSSGDALVYSTYLGGSGSDSGDAIAVDGSGNAYLTGYTYSADFPTQDPIQPNLAGSGDAFVTKINPSGDVLVYSTYLGGSGLDSGHGIGVDSSGNVYLTGETGSQNFPTQDPIQPNNGGSADAFVTKINPSGDALVYSTYLGGSDMDFGSGLAVDGSGNAYLTGLTYSTDFPTQAPIQPNLAGPRDAFVTKINPSGDVLVYSTYLGGGDYDWGRGIAVDGSGNAYLTGSTSSTDFPTQDPIQPNLAGPRDAFVTKINPSGDVHVYSTYLGGGDYDTGSGIAVDGSGNVYLTGSTSSTDFPTWNPIQPNNGGSADAFVTKINPSGDTLLYSTYLGGSDYDSGQGIAADGSGNVYLIGETRSQDFPTRDPIQPNHGGGEGDAFVTTISEDVQATYDATGIWSYSTTNNWVNPGTAGCTAQADETRTVTVTQTGNTVELVADGITFTGSVGGAYYTLSASYPEDGGTTTVHFTFTLSSSTSGSGTVTWSWTDGTRSCNGGSDLTITKPLALEAPNGGEVIPSGSNYTIEWEAPLEMATFKLKCSMDNGKQWIPIDSGITDTSYGWTVPTPRKNKKKCLVKVIGYDGSEKKVGADRSDWPFTIEVVKLTSPNGGETCTSGDPYTITWTTNGTKKPVEKVVLKYTQNGGKKWKKIDRLAEDTGTYEWTVPGVPKAKGKCLVKVVLKDANGKTVGSDTSDGYFTIEP